MKIVLELTEEEARWVRMGLGTQPFDKVAGVVWKLTEIVRMAAKAGTRTNTDEHGQNGLNGQNGGEKKA